MVLSSGEILTIGSGLQSQVGGTALIKRYALKPDEGNAVEIPKSTIKYHKIGKHDKYKVTGILPEYYISDKQVPKTNVDNLIKLSSKYQLVSFKIPDESNDYYVNSCYMIDFISSPVRCKGEGTKAIKALVEKSITDKDTKGRIITDVRIIDGQTSAAGFFYKLGFRFVDKNKNEQMQNWINDTSAILSPQLTGLMYLPQEGTKRLLMYKMLL